MTDPIPPGAKVIEIHIARADQLFNTIDPSPFHERDLSREADEFIVGWARDLPHESSLALRVWIDDPSSDAGTERIVRDAIRRYYALRATETRRGLRRFFRNGRIALLIGLVVLTAAAFASTRVADTGGGSLVLRESLLIGGWVAMWRPLEVFLYDWWPIRADARLFDRLATMPVSVLAATQTGH